MSIRITQLITYPIKSCAGIQHQHSAVNHLGLQGDRMWMVVDANSRFLSQRQHPIMALIQPRWESDVMWLSAPGHPDCAVTITADSRVVSVWKDQLQAQKADAVVNVWLSQVIGSDVSLVHYGAMSERLIEPEHNNGDERVAFADGYPILVTHEASLDAVNAALPEPIAMSRFRPNVVVTTDEAAWAELNWQTLTAESGSLSLRKPCARCVMTGVDQDTGQAHGSGVLKTLKNEFAHQDKAVFGMNAVPNDQLTELRVGMSLSSA